MRGALLLTSLSVLAACQSAQTARPRPVPKRMLAAKPAVLRDALNSAAAPRFELVGRQTRPLGGDVFEATAFLTPIGGSRSVESLTVAPKTAAKVKEIRMQRSSGGKFLRGIRSGAVAVFEDVPATDVQVKIIVEGNPGDWGLDLKTSDTKQ